MQWNEFLSTIELRGNLLPTPFLNVSSSWRKLFLGIIYILTSSFTRRLQKKKWKHYSRKLHCIDQRSHTENQPYNTIFLSFYNSYLSQGDLHPKKRDTEVYVLKRKNGTGICIEGNHHFPAIVTLSYLRLASSFRNTLRLWNLTMAEERWKIDAITFGLWHRRHKNGRRPNYISRSSTNEHIPSNKMQNLGESSFYGN